MDKVITFLGKNIGSIILSQDFLMNSNIFEIRLRIDSPIFIKSISGDYFLDKDRKSKKVVNDFYKIKKRDIDETVSNLTLNSIHAFEKEMKSGFITIEGGHRVGFGGDCIYDMDKFKGYKNITSLNIRISKEFKGCSERYLKHFIKNSDEIYNTLILGPPLSGKTTFIRDLSKNLSNGFLNPPFNGCDVTIIDERGEISSVYNGVAQTDVGVRTDILAYCMKTEGFLMSIRSLSPKIIICDELGSKDDFEIIQYALKSGVNIISTAHGSSIEDVKKNIYLKDIFENKFFDRIVILKDRKNPSSVKEIYDMSKDKVIFNDKV